MIDFPVPTFVSCSFTAPLMRCRTSPFASAGYVVRYWLFDTGVASNSKLHTRPARKWADCCSSVIAILVGLPFAAESVVG